jgi:hypothetical protein
LRLNLILNKETRKKIAVPPGYNRILDEIEGRKYKDDDEGGGSRLKQEWGFLHFVFLLFLNLTIFVKESLEMQKISRSQLRKDS